MNDRAPKTDPTAASQPGLELSAEANEEQLLYARILATGMYVGLGVLLLTFALYLTGALPAAVPIEELPNLWTLSAGVAQAVLEKIGQCVPRADLLRHAPPVPVVEQVIQEPVPATA